MKPTKLLLLILASQTLLFTGCGTDTGNPTLTSPLPSYSNQPASSFVSSNLCSKISTCFGITPTNCDTQVSNASLIVTHLGLSEATYPNLIAIQTAVDSSVLQVNATKANLCFQAIYYASCTDLVVQDSFNPNTPNDITRIWRLLNLDTNCSQFIF